MNMDPNKKAVFVKLNEEIKGRIIEKLTIISKILMELSPNDVIIILDRDASIMNEALKGLINKQMISRKLGGTDGSGNRVVFKKNMYNSFSRTLGKTMRGVNRFTSAKDYQEDILTELSILLGFFLLLKSQQDEAVLYYKEKYGENPLWKEIWEKIEGMPEYKNYLFPPSTQEMLQDASQEAKASSAETNSIIDNVGKSIDQQYDAQKAEEADAANTMDKEIKGEEQESPS